MNQLTKRILCSGVAFIFLVSACAPAPAATQDPQELQQLIEQSIEKAFDRKATEQALSAPQMDGSLPTQTAPATTIPPILTPTTTPFVLTPPDPSSPTPDRNLPTIESINPASGYGGDPVTITGTNFIPERTAFYFGDTQDETTRATDVKCESSTQCTAFSPKLSQPTTSGIKVTAVIIDDVAAGVSSSQNDVFEYLIPPASTITEIFPVEGETYGGTLVTIKGTNFIPGKTTFVFGDKPATAVDCLADTVTCTAKTQPNTEGEVTVTAYAAGVKSANDKKFSYKVPPTIESVTPDSGPKDGRTQVTIKGSNFTEQTIFYFGELTATKLKCIYPTECVVTAPVFRNSIITKADGGVVVEAVNGSIKSKYDPTGDTKQSFLYLNPTSYECGAITLRPELGQDPMKPGEEFEIVWLIKNIGTRPWPASQKIKFSSGVNMAKVTSMVIGKIVQPNDTVRIPLQAFAPDKPYQTDAKGLTYMTWIVEGQGCSLYVAIRVEKP